MCIRDRHFGCLAASCWPSLGWRNPLKPLSILQVIGGGEIAGSKHQFLELCRELQGRGHHLSIITFLEGELSADARKLGIPIQILPMQNIFDFHVIPPLRKKIKREGFQICLLYTSP